MRIVSIISAICLLVLMSSALQAQSNSKSEKKDRPLSNIFKKKEATEAAQKAEVKSSEKPPLKKWNEDELKNSHKDARKEVRASKKERKAAEAREDAARARAEALRAQKRVIKADKKVDKKEEIATKARTKASKKKQ